MVFSLIIVAAVGIKDSGFDELGDEYALGQRNPKLQSSWASWRCLCRPACIVTVGGLEW